MSQFERAYNQLVIDLLKHYDRQTPHYVRGLREHQVFVFGTDTKGAQRLGAAGLARRSFGAEKGVTEGLTGDAYALPTRGFTFKETTEAVARFETFVRENPDRIFLVTAIGCGHAGNLVSKVAPLFAGCLALDNVWLPEEFLKFYKKQAELFFKEQESVTTDDEVFLYYDEEVHDVIRYLLLNNIKFNRDGGFSLYGKDDIVIAEAELGIESMKVVISPYDGKNREVFVKHGYTVMDSKSFLEKYSAQ